MKTEKELRQQITYLETQLKSQTEELEGLFESTLQQLQWKNIVTEAVRALLHFTPLQQLLFKSTLRFGAFKISMALLEKIKQLFKTPASKTS